MQAKDHAARGWTDDEVRDACWSSNELCHPSKSGFDFSDANGKVFPKAYPVTLSEAGPTETVPKRFERYARQVSRCVQACTLCQRGCEHKLLSDNVYHDPHTVPSMIHSQVAMVRYEPKETDYGRLGLFGAEKPIFDEIGLSFDAVYKTTMIKCIGSGDPSPIPCPYFGLELVALRPGLIIAMDERACVETGHGYMPGEFIKCNYDNQAKFNLFAVADLKQLRAILKLVKAAQSSLQISNRLFA